MEHVPPDETPAAPEPAAPEPATPKPAHLYYPHIEHAIWELERKVRRGRPSEVARRALLTAHVEQLRMMEEHLGVPVEGRSFALVQGRVATGVLLVAGEREGCERLRTLGENLHAEGFTVLASSLSYRALDRLGVSPTYWQTCLDEAENRYDMLDHYASRIAILGVGLGAAVALHLAARKRVYAVGALFPVLDASVGLGDSFRALLRRVLPRTTRKPMSWPLQRRTAARQAQGKVGAPVVVVAEERRDRSDAGRSLRAVRSLMAHRPLQLLLVPQAGPVAPDALPGEILAQLVAFLKR